MAREVSFTAIEFEENSIELAITQTPHLCSIAIHNSPKPITNAVVCLNAILI